jgi:hypothetical protein
MKYDKAISLIIPAVISFFMLFSAYVSGTRVVEFAHLGFPNYFRIELTMAKVIGALALLIPQIPARIKEWIYVCFGVVLIRPPSQNSIAAIRQREFWNPFLYSRS